MSKWGIWVLAAVLIAVAVACGPKANAREDVAAVKAQMEAYGPAASSGDTAALLALYADGAVRLSQHVPIVVGKEAIRAQWQADFDSTVHSETDLAEDVQVVGDMAVARGVWQGENKPKLPGGAMIQDKGKQIFIYGRQPGGDWKIVADIWNSDLPAIQTLAPSTPDELALLQLERDWSDAWLKQDAKVLDAILADSYLENLGGKITTKKQLIAEMKSGIYEPESLEASDMRVVVFGEHAVVNGVTAAKGRTRGIESNDKRRWTDTYEKREGRWRAVFTHYIDIK